MIESKEKTILLQSDELSVSIKI